MTVFTHYRMSYFSVPISRTPNIKNTFHEKILGADQYNGMTDWNPSEHQPVSAHLGFYRRQVGALERTGI